MIHTKDVIAKLIKKSPWHDGQFPGKRDKPYRTRQLIFEVEGDNEKDEIRMNVKDDNPITMEWNKLKIGEKVKSFKMLLDGKPIINPTSSFVKHHDNALF